MVQIPGDRRHLGVAVGVVLVAVVLLAVVTPFIIFEHPLAKLGFGGTPGTEFETLNDYADTYSEHLVHNISDGDRAIETSWSAIHFANGTIIRTHRVLVDSERKNDVTDTVEVRLDDDGYRARRYRNGSRPPASEIDGIVEGQTVYERIPASNVNSFGLADRSILSELVYARDGITTRNGERVVRYDVVGERDDAVPALGGKIRGYVLVTPNQNVIRYAFVSTSDSQFIYSSSLEASAGIPRWVRATWNDETDR